MVAPTYFRTLAPNSDNNTIDNITNRVWTNFGSKMFQTSSLSCYIFCSPCSYPWAYRKEKIRGAETNLPDFFGFCPTSAKKFFPENINFDDPPRQKNFGQCTILGVQKIFRNTNFPDITKFATKFTQFPKKLTKFVPFF